MADIERWTIEGLPGMERWTLHRCAGCGRVAMGRSPEEHCPNTDRMEAQEAFEVVPATAIEGAVERIAELERENLELRSQVAAYVEHLREYGDPADDPTGGV